MTRPSPPAPAWLAPVWLAVAGACHAATFCDTPAHLSAGDEGRLLRVAGVVKDQLDRSGATLALVSRSGLDLDRFGQRYSHAGVSLQRHPQARWAVRQLYYACDESAPRLFDQGMAAFVRGMDAPAPGYVSIVFLPPLAAADVERVALASDRALALTGTRYSANAYPFSVQYQNCNQWVAELLAAAWGQPSADGDARAQAQAWLREQGYAATVFDVGWPLSWAAAFVPWVHRDDHPEEDRRAGRWRVSMPASIEAFVRATVPGATRVEVCHAAGRVVVHRGWTPVAEGCVAGDGDEVIPLD